MEPKFIVEFTVNSHDTDKNGNLHPSALLRMFHEAANLQFESGHPTLDELRYREKKAFLLSRASVAALRPIRAFESVRVATWAGGGRAAAFYRCGEITVAGETVGRLVSVWALRDLENGRLCRVKDVTLPFASLEEYPLEIPGHTRFPSELVLTEVGTRKICNSDIDVNRHMNNTNYPDMLTDYIPAMETMTVKDFCINYVHEAPLGMVLTVLYGYYEGRHYVRTLREDGSVNAEGVFTLEVGE